MMYFYIAPDLQNNKLTNKCGKTPVNVSFRRRFTDDEDGNSRPVSWQLLMEGGREE